MLCPVYLTGIEFKSAQNEIKLQLRCADYIVIDNKIIQAKKDFCVVKIPKTPNNIASIAHWLEDNDCGFNLTFDITTKQYIQGRQAWGDHYQYQGDNLVINSELAARSITFPRVGLPFQQ